MSLEKIQERIRDFASERNWEQFHNPKNLAMAIGSETGELLEIYQCGIGMAKENLVSLVDTIL